VRGQPPGLKLTDVHDAHLVGSPGDLEARAQVARPGAAAAARWRSGDDDEHEHPGSWTMIRGMRTQRWLAAVPILLLALMLAPALPALQPADALRVVSYNIRHGRGNDDVVDLERTARVLRALSPDIVGLQEVDERATRSGGVPQAVRLGELLGMHHAFGRFMDYQGGAYGLAILSRQATAIGRILRHLGLWTDLPVARPARAPPLLVAAGEAQADQYESGL
jgi:hypothetical protein